MFCGLEDITLPKSLVHISDNAFDFYNSAQRIQVEDDWDFSFSSVAKPCSLAVILPQRIMVRNMPLWQLQGLG